MNECFHASLFSHFQYLIPKYAFPLFPFYSFDNNDMKSSKRHAVLLSLIFLIQYLSLKDFKAAEKMSLTHAREEEF